MDTVSIKYKTYLGDKKCTPISSSTSAELEANFVNKSIYQVELTKNFAGLAATGTN